jgi:hypothetical protein
MPAMKKVGLARATAGIFTSCVTQSALNGRGNDLLYDVVLDVTCLQDANSAKTSAPML